ncbi:MAG: fasciclin domain-containing protein [Candidatus Auribacter fodinae]|jgi:uncharacterized surface protein with fasciclin (FAS1) repeats|uniref:Fasciclin domain-containing protein n=1 Tax=Candidatus Auribacter fodinae TaxID=2093366 RepID=A0A3A4QPI7_9BACT|nr:MAG: fasciclin domain-containing protein [Candidatus Auribacter fodinae]
MTAKHGYGICLTGCIALIMMVTGCAHTPSATAPDTVMSKAGTIKQLSTFVSAVNSAGLAETLQGAGPFTVFAPVNKAFEALGEEKLAELMNAENSTVLSGVLSRHVIPETIVADDIQGVLRKPTANGQEVTLSVFKDRVMVDNADIIKTDIKCSNGVIHLIDTVILPAAEEQEEEEKTN